MILLHETKKDALLLDTAIYHAPNNFDPVSMEDIRSNYFLVLAHVLYL